MCNYLPNWINGPTSEKNTAPSAVFGVRKVATQKAPANTNKVKQYSIVFPFEATLYIQLWKWVRFVYSVYCQENQSMKVFSLWLHFLSTKNYKGHI